MAINLNACRQSPAGNIITAKGRLSYPYILRPGEQKGKGGVVKEKWSTSLLFPTAADLAVLSDAVEKCAIAEFGADYKTKIKLRKPFLKTEEQPKMASLADAFPVFIRSSSNNAPQVVDAMGKAVSDLEAVYPGRWALLSVRPYAYDFKDPDSGLRATGVSLGLQNVQLLEHDEAFGAVRAKAEDEFEAIEGVDGGAVTTTADLF